MLHRLLACLGGGMFQKVNIASHTRVVTRLNCKRSANKQTQIPKKSLQKKIFNENRSGLGDMDRATLIILHICCIHDKRNSFDQNEDYQ